MTTAVSDVRHYLDSLRADEKLCPTDDEAAAWLDAGDTETAFRACARVAPFVIQSHYPNILREECYPDVLQEANIGILMSFKSWKPHRGSSLVTWAYSYARRYAVAEIQRQMTYCGRFATHDFREAYEDGEASMWNPDDRAYDEPEGSGQRQMEFEAEYDYISQRLTARQRLLLDMMRDQMSQEEMGKILGVDQPGVSRLIGELKTFLHKTCS